MSLGPILRGAVTQEMNGTLAVPGRRIFRRLSITAGNAIQIAGIAASVLCLLEAASTSSKKFSVAAFIGGWLFLYFCCHGIAHWLVGRLLGIRFAFYTVGGTANPAGWPGGLRWVFEHLPFFGVQTERNSMQTAPPIAKAMMWSAGVMSSATVPALGAFWAWHSSVPYSKLFLLIAVGWSIGTLASNWTSQKGDFSKARRALAGS